MKSTITLAAVALLATAGIANAQNTTRSSVAPRNLTRSTDAVCAENQAANAEIIARAMAAPTPAARKAILQDAINANPNNAVCLADLALQMGAANVNPAAGPDEFGATGETPTTTDGTGTPAENPYQLNQGGAVSTTSPNSPAL